MKQSLPGVIGAAVVVAGLSASAAYAQAPYSQLRFYAKNGCKGRQVAQVITSRFKAYNCTVRSGFCENDAARSVFVERNIRLPIGITMWDNSDGEFESDDWAHIHIWKRSQSMRTGTGVCIPSFEANYGKTWMSISWNHGDNLDGKVSKIEVSNQ